MERITSLGRIISVLIQDGFSSGYLQLFKPSLRIEQDKELMRYFSQPHAPLSLSCLANTHIFINHAVTLNALLIESKNENVFYENNYWFHTSKRAFDICFSLAVIIFILSWLLPVIAILIRIESKGSAIFSQKRSSRDNNTFDCYKFRSMHLNEESNISQTAKGDTRVTKIGAFLRRTNLDELPQFFNVLLGHMSVVGPRPHMLCQTKEYAELIDIFMVRHLVKPGITGWAQVNGLRGQTTNVHQMLNRVEADVWYLKNWSFLLDMKIIILTAFYTVVGDKNAY
jgi:lipopolysaccharide/colanic/teichoic acid biosynthesis glycosyltransferase